MKTKGRWGQQQPEVEKFLTFVANNVRTLDDAEDALRKYGQFLPPQLTSVTAKNIALREIQWEGVFGPQLTPIALRKERVGLVVGGLSAKLRKIWTEQDPRRREWFVYKTRDFYHQFAEPALDVPADSPFEQAMMHLVQNADRMGRCINPECPAPFFLGKDSHGRTFCSSSCAGPAKRLAKLKWWRQNPQRRRWRRQS